MSDQVKKLQNERTQLFTDLYTGTISKRVPINTSLPLEYMIEYAGKKVWTQSKETTIDPVLKTIPEFKSQSRYF